MGGLLLIDKTADFSASAIGDAGLYTSITTGLTTLHETRRNSRKATNNAVANQANGSTFGSPSFSAGYGSFDTADGVKFGTKPASGGLTVALCLQVYNRATSDNLVGSLPGTSATQGAVYFTMFNRRLTLNAYDYPSATPPLSGQQGPSVFMDFASGDDGNFELMFGVLEDNVSLRLYRPKTKVTATNARVGRYFAFDGPVSFQMPPTQGGASSFNAAIFGAWQSVLSAANMDTIYAELQAQAANYGLTIA